MWNEKDFCDADAGFEYIFSRMQAIYGGRFASHWNGIDPQIIRHEWKEQLGRFLTYRPSMDYAISKLDGEFVPSAIKFRNLCNAGPDIPSKPVLRIEKQLTAEQKAIIEEHKAKARAWFEAHKGKHR
jgi:hypothetical protein